MKNLPCPGSRSARLACECLETRVVPSISGQWASALVDFSTQYTDSYWSAAQVLGAPDTPNYGDSIAAWAPLPANSDDVFDAEEFLTLRFPTAVYATGVLVRETLGNGFVDRVDFLFIDDQGNTQTIATWTGADPSQPGAPASFLATIPTTASLVNAVTVRINIDRDSYWEEIDAVKLLDGVIDPTSGPTDISLSNHTVLENQFDLIVVGTLAAADPSPEETFSYSVVGDASSLFTIDGDQ